MESVWKPVAANEGFEVVRRRLFLPCKDEAARDAVCTAFSRMYQENSSDFPMEAKEVEYRNRMISCYPIHPEVLIVYMMTGQLWTASSEHVAF